MDTKSKTPQAGGDTRREFIRKSSLAAAAVASGTTFLKTPVYGQTTAPSTGRVIGANDRITVGVIGVGGQGMAHVRHAARHSAENNVGIAAVCDVWEKRRRNAQGFVNKAIDDQPWAKGLAKLEDKDVYLEYEKLLARKDIDAVFVATVDHWHAKICIEAMEAGKHVYVEKPITRYLDEAFKVHDVTKRTGKVLTVGSQGCSDAKWHKAAELIRAGKIGPLVLGQGSYMRNAAAKGGEWNYTIDPDARPDNLDWKRWLGPVSNRPFDADAFFRWRKYYPYCAGLLGDLFPHRLHPLMVATGNPEYPTRVVSLGTRKISTDRDVPDNVQVLAEFPSGLTLMVTSSTVNERGLDDMIRGHHGTLYFSGNRVELRPERPFSEEIDPENFENLRPGEGVEHHQRDWFESIRSNRLPTGNIDLAIRVQTVITLAEMSERLNTMCLFDEKTRRITNGDGKTVAPITYGTLPLS